MSGEERPKPTAQPVGHQLRRAREALGLDISAIADQQHLRVSIIQAIEKGDYSKIDTELFLKGYVRAYAKQVGLDGDAIIRDLDVELEPRRKERERQMEADPLVDIERRKRRKRRVARTVVVLVVLGALAAGISSYMADSDSPLPFGSKNTTETNAQDEPGSEPESVSDEPASDPVEGNETEEPVNEPGVNPVDESAEALDEPGEPALQVVVAEPLAMETDSGDLALTESAVPDTNNPEDVAAFETDSLSEQPQTAGTEPVAGNSELLITFIDDCWVQVTDATGNRLASRLQTEGDVLRLDGVAPLDVVVGAMSAVESIRFRNEPVNLDNIRTVNNRAQFTLEP